MVARPICVYVLNYGRPNSVVKCRTVCSRVRKSIIVNMVVIIEHFVLPPSP